jgi:hypothetical protein
MGKDLEIKTLHLRKCNFRYRDTLYIGCFIIIYVDIQKQDGISACSGPRFDDSLGTEIELSD